MIKAREKRDPQSCFSKAFEGEMLFVLLGRDAVAADTVRYWIRRRIETGKNAPNDPQILEAESCAKLMEQQAASAVCWKDTEEGNHAMC